MELLNNFKDRVEEIEIYFSFVSQVDKVETHKQKTIKINDKDELSINRDTQKVLRANCFILLYNLVESTIRNGIWSVFDSIEDDETKYSELSDKIKNLWLEDKRKEISDLSSPKKLKENIQSLIEDEIVNREIQFSREKISISGNLDYRSIKKIINDFGFFGNLTIPDEKILGKALLKIKSERNALAHGNKSFRKCAEIVTIQKLIEYKDAIINYLEQVAKNIESFVEKKKYKK